MEPSRKLDQLANEVIGAAIEVHRHLGPGYLESVYEEALGIELVARGLSAKCQPEVCIRYKGKQVGTGRLDLLVEDLLVVELKAVDSLLPIHKAQLISYLKMTGLQLGLLINFNTAVLRQGIQRVIVTA